MNRRLLIILLVAIIGCGQPFFPEASRGKGKGPKPPPEPVEMAEVFFDGFERRVDGTGSSRHPWSLATGSTASARTGSRAANMDGSGLLRYQCRDYNFDHSGGDNFFSIPTAYVSFYLRRYDTDETDDNNILEFLSDSTTQKLVLRWGTGNVLKVVNATGTTTGTTALGLNQWYRIDVQVGTGASAFWEVRIDGTSEMSATENLLTGNNAVFEFDSDTDQDNRIDDVVIRDDQYQPGDDYRVETIFPDGDGFYTSWTGTWTDVDEKSADGTEVTTDTQNNRETYTLESISALSADDTIESVMVVARVRKTAGGAVNCQMIERESSTDRDTANFVLLDNTPDNQTFRWLIRDTKPSGGAWTESAVNGYEVGLEHNQSQSRDIFLDNINVNVLISTTAAPAGGKAGFMTLLGVQ